MSNYDSKMSDFDFVRNRPRKGKEPLEPPKTPRKFQIVMGIYLTVVLGVIYVIARILIFAATWTVAGEIIEFFKNFYNFLFLIVVFFNYSLFYFTIIEPFKLKGKIYQKNRSPDAREKRRYLGLFIPSLISMGIIVLVFFLMYANPNRLWMQSPGLLFFTTFLFIFLFSILITLPFYLLSDHKVNIVEKYIALKEIAEKEGNLIT